MGFFKSITAASGIVGTHIIFGAGYIIPEIARLALKGTVVSAELIEKLARHTANKAKHGETVLSLLIVAMEHKEEATCNKIKEWSERDQLPSDKEVNKFLEELINLNKGATQ